MKNKIEDHKLIQALKYAYENKTFTKSGICRDLNMTENEFTRFVKNEIGTWDPCSINQSDNGEWVMTYDALLHYIEYIELQDARNDSKTAKIYSIVAISISALLALISIIISMQQINTTSTVKLDKSQLEKILYEITSPSSSESNKIKTSLQSDR